MHVDVLSSLSADCLGFDSQSFSIRKFRCNLVFFESICIENCNLKWQTCHLKLQRRRFKREQTGENVRGLCLDANCCKTEQLIGASPEANPSFRGHTVKNSFGCGR